MTTPEIGNPSYEEGVLLALDAGNFSPAVEWAINGLRLGRSPGILSVVRPDLLEGFTTQLHDKLRRLPGVLADSEHPKTIAFESILPEAEAGSPSAINALPKLATSVGQLAASTELLLDNIEGAKSWRRGRTYVQFIGSFNPQHVGHRSTIKDTLTAAGDRASGIVQVVQNHPIKKDSLPPYEGRFMQGEEKLYSSTLVHPFEVTMLDLPLGLGLAKRGADQIRLLTRVTGDNRMRWLVGSDKFMTDVENVRSGKQLDKAGVRFSNVHMYVARRDTETTGAIEEGATYVHERFGAEVTIVPEAQDPLIIRAAASKIRDLRAQGRHEEAHEMEYADIPSSGVQSLERRWQM